MRRIVEVIAQGREYRIGDVTYDCGTLARFEECGNGVSDPRNGYAYTYIFGYDQNDKVVLHFISNDLTIVYGDALERETNE